MDLYNKQLPWYAPEPIPIYFDLTKTKKAGEIKSFAPLSVERCNFFLKVGVNNNNRSIHLYYFFCEGKNDSRTKSFSRAVRSGRSFLIMIISFLFYQISDIPLILFSNLQEY